jgi:hypothetical protein
MSTNGLNFEASKAPPSSLTPLPITTNSSLIGNPGHWGLMWAVWHGVVLRLEVQDA